MRTSSPRLIVSTALCATLAVLAATLTPAGAASASDPIREQRDIVWRTVDEEALTLDAYLPARVATDRPAVLLIHGGGWRTGSKDSLADQGRQLAALGYDAFSIDYRLAPAHPYPAAVEDVQAAVKWLREPAQVKKFGLDPHRIGALGSSAGAHLTGMLATLGHGSLAAGARVRAAVSWSGPMDFTSAGIDPATLTPVQLQRISGGSVSQFLGCSPLECADTAAAASPITSVDATDAPMLIANSDAELVPLRQAQRMNDALEHAGVAHQLIVLSGSAHARAYAAVVWDQTVAFLEQHLGPPKT